MADPLHERRQIGRSALKLPRVGFGCGPIGGSQLLDDASAAAVLAAAWDAGLRYFDTAPWYGNTQSEHRLGTFLRTRDAGSFNITTKVGRVYRAPRPGEDFGATRWRKRWPGGLSFIPQFDYSRSGILRSYEDSLARLGLPRVDALAIHDLDQRHQSSEEGIEAGFAALEAGGFAALAELKASGAIDAIGAGINFAGLIPRFLERFPIDYFVLSMPYTLLDQAALAQELPLCEMHGASVIIGAPFASGILASGSIPGATYAYAPVADDVRERVMRIEKHTTAHGVSLPAAALQFPLAHPQVAAIIPGAEKAEHVRANVASVTEPIPAAFWRALVEDGLIDPAAPLPAP
ncbi:MAG: aldo/keto reductase [Pseudomonadota bacterium]